MANPKQQNIPGVDLPDTVKQGLQSQLRKLRMAETRQEKTLEETKEQIAAIEAIIAG